MRLLSPAAGTLRGWLVPGRRGAGVVLLLHGIGGSRLDMVERARFLHATGYTVLFFDSRAHGESGGERITFGYLESSMTASHEAPVLMIAETADRPTTRVESHRLFARAQPPKELWEVPGAGHVDFHQVARTEYEARAGRFLARALRPESADGLWVGFPLPRPRGNIMSRPAARPGPRWDRQAGGRGMGAVTRGFGWLLMVVAALIVFFAALLVVEPLGWGAGEDFDPSMLAMAVGVIVLGGLLGALGAYLAFARRWAR